MTDNLNNTSFLSDLLKRRVPHILFIYGAGCWTIIQIVEWVIGRYLISPHLTDLCLVAMVSFIPSIALIAYFHGTPGRDEWHPIEKIGIPINLFASLLILFISFYPKDLGAITETIVVEDELGHKMEKIIPKREFRKKVSIFNFRNLSKNEDIAWVSHGLISGIIIDHADELMTNLLRGQHHYLAFEKNYLPNDELPLNLMLDIARQNKTKYLLFGDHSMDDDIYDVTTYLYDVNASRLEKERKYKNENLFTIIDNISHDLKIDMEIPEQYVKTSKDLPFNEICTKSMDAYKEFCKARYCTNSNLYVESEAHLHKSLEHDDKFAFAYRALLSNAYRTNKGKDELEHYSNMVLNTMHNIPEHYQRNGRISHAREIEKDFNKTKMIVEMEIKLNPDDLNLRMQLVSIYTHQLEFEKAIKGLEYCYSINPESWYLLQIIFNYSSMREYAKALEYANIYMDKYPDDDLGYLHASLLYGKQGNVQKQKDYMFKCIIIDPEYLFGECEVDYFSYLLKEINYEELTNKYYDKIRRSQTDEDKAVVYINLSNFYSVHGLIDSAIYHNDLAIRIRTRQTPSRVSMQYLNLIPYYMNMGREELAKEIFEKYGGKGHIGESDLSQAIIYLHDNQHEKAHEFVNEKINAMNREGNLMFINKPQFLKGLIYQKSNDHENAIIAFEKLLQFSPVFFRYHSLDWQADELVFLLMSQSHHQLGNMESAREWIEKAYHIDSFGPHIQYQMALLEYDDGNHGKAMEYLEYCLEIWKHADDDFPPLMEAREKLRSWNLIN